MAPTPHEDPIKVQSSRAPHDAPEVAQPDPNEQEMLDRLARGDRGALEELLVSAQPRLMALCVRMASDSDHAADLCQQAMVKIIQGLPLFGGRSRLTTWMTRVAINVCLSDRRRLRLRRTLSLDALSCPPNGDGPEGPGTPSDPPDAREPSPPERIQRSEQLRRLTAGIAAIDPQQRALLILRDARGLDYAEIAEILSVPVGTIKSRLFRARQALREQIEGATEPDGGQRWTAPVSNTT